MNFKDLDKKAKLIAKEYLRYEAELLNIILEIDQKKAFYQLGYSSLYAYVHEALKLSPAISYALIAVARKSKDVPELKTKIEAGELSLSKAQKMAAVLTPENQNQ